MCPPSTGTAQLSAQTTGHQNGTRHDAGRLPKRETARSTGVELRGLEPLTPTLPVWSRRVRGSPPMCVVAGQRVARTIADWREPVRTPSAGHHRGAHPPTLERHRSSTQDHRRVGGERGDSRTTNSILVDHSLPRGCMCAGRERDDVRLRAHRSAANRPLGCHIGCHHSAGCGEAKASVNRGVLKHSPRYVSDCGGRA